jgi:phosphotransferase system enzyme I (PtsP)
MLNAGLQLDLPQLAATGADGIGLYRTEIPFMARAQLPDVAAQTQLYTRILDQAAGKPVLFRTLDVGSDKLLPYWQSEVEDNPALGWRSIRITLDRPMVLRQQLRALIAASAGRDLHVMFPMVAEVAEFDQARGTLDLELERGAGKQAEAPRSIRVGTMLEVPALAWQIDTLLKRIDFLSIGSNDLTQFMFAIDRGNPRIADRYDVLSPGMLALLKHLVERCRVAGKTLSVCGEMAGRPIEAMALLGLGVRTLSMSAPSVGPVKAMVRSVNLPQLEDFMADLLYLPDHSLRERLRAFAVDHGVVI